MNRPRNIRPAGPQPQYRDGRRPWAVDAVRIGSKPQTFTTIYVTAHTAEAARQAAKPILRNLMRARGQPHGWGSSARPATCGELDMVPLDERA